MMICSGGGAGATSHGAPAGNSSQAPSSGGSAGGPGWSVYSTITLFGSARCASRPVFEVRIRSVWCRRMITCVRVTTSGIDAHRHTRRCRRQRGQRSSPGSKAFVNGGSQ